MLANNRRTELFVISQRTLMNGFSLKKMEMLSVAYTYFI